MDRWVKLYIKIWNSDMFQGHKNKSNMILVWIWFLTHAKDGKCTFGRNQIAKDTGLNPSSVQRAIVNIATLTQKPFSEQQILYQPNNSYSTVLILNWHKYQDNPNNPKVLNRTRTEQQPITNKNKNKNIYNTNEKNIINIFPEVKQVIEHYKEIYGIKTLSRQTEQVRAARDLLQDYGLDKVLRAIEIAHEASGHEYAPMIGNLNKLKEKYSDLQLWYKRNHKDEKKKMDDEVGEIKNSLGKIIKRGK